MKTKIKSISILLAGSLSLFLACENKKDEGLKVEEFIPVSIISIEKGQENTTAEATGLFSTDDETLLSFKNGGIIEHIYVKEGDFVKQGQLLAVLNMTELNAKAEQVRIAMEKAERDLNRAKKLYKDSVATLEQFQNAQTAVDVLEQDWNTLQFNLKYSQIRANNDGYILLKLANDGQIVGPGMPIFQMNSAGKGNWVVKVGVSDVQWASIKVGDSATISTDAFSDVLYARVIRKSEGLDPNSGTFTVHVQPQNIENVPVATGMFARVKIFGVSPEYWQIPYGALLDGDRGKGYVYVTDDKETVKKVEVEIAGIQKDKVLISSGLENHPYIIVSGSPYLKEDSKINVIE